MKYKLANSALLVCLVSISLTHSAARAQSSEGLQSGNKLTTEVITFGTRGREIFPASTLIVESVVEATIDFYTLVRLNNKTTFNRTGHFAVSTENAAGVKQVPENLQVTWMPPNRDFTKPWQVKYGFQSTQNCGGGIGQVALEANSKPVRFAIRVRGTPTEFDAFEAMMIGTWTSGTCGVGKQIMKFVYVPAINLVAENLSQGFQSDGFLYSGRTSKVVAID